MRKREGKSINRLEELRNAFFVLITASESFRACRRCAKQRSLSYNPLDLFGSKPPKMRLNLQFSSGKLLFGFVFLTAFYLFFAASIKATRLPLNLYGSSDGLASGSILNIERDSRGFLWFSTRNGLSRFDGREFVNFRLEDQTNSPIFYAAHEARDGSFWISTSDGLYRVKPSASTEARPETVSSDETDSLQTLSAEKIGDVVANSFFEDSRGRIWSGGNELFLIAENDEVKIQQFDLGAIARVERGASVNSIYEAADGSLWIACDAGALRLLPDNRRILYPIKRQTGYDETRSILADEAGRIWVGHSTGVFVFQPEDLNALSNVPDLSVRQLNLAEKIVETSGAVILPAQPREMLRLMFDAGNVNKSNSERQTWSIDRIFKSSDGKIWVPASGSLFVFEGENCRRLSDVNGFPGAITDLAEDASGNLWIATEGGALRFNRQGITSWGQADGLLNPRIHSFFESKNGELFVIHGNWMVSRVSEERIETTSLQLPDADRFLWTSSVALFDSSENWWALSSNGLYSFGAAANLNELSGRKPLQIYGLQDGFKSSAFYAAFEDKDGNIWFSTRDKKEYTGLARFDKTKRKFRFFTTEDGLPEGFAARSFAHDRAGNIWLGGYEGGLLRFANERFTDFSNAENAPKGGILALHVDRRNHLWIGSTRDGLSLVENPLSDRLNFRRYTTEQNLAADNVRSLTSDFDGNIYVGTIRGVDRLDPETGNVRHYSTADGLAADNVSSAFCDRLGRIWFGTPNGLSRIEPATQTIVHSRSPRVFINSLEIAGKQYAVSDFGQEKVENIAVESSEDNLRINFLSIGDALRYQYKLEKDGAEHAWSNLSAERTVNFAGLAPGSYKFFARAVDATGRVGENPALVSFTIRQPFWKTWQFIGAIILITGFGVFLLDRYRVAKTRQVENALSKSLESERIARESEMRFRTLAQTASDAIITIDVESQIVFVNEAVRKIFGFKTDELIGEKLTILMPNEFHRRHDAGLKGYVKTGTKNISWSGVELMGKHKSGAEIPLELSFGEFEIEGKRYFTGVARDISERKRAEETIRKTREDRIKELQRVRTRIATDLHDDIGSSLTQIAVLSEVARAQAILDSVKAPLERISDVSNELVDAMADIVWAINPKKDTLRELVLRMRRFASDVLSAKEIEFEFEAPETDMNISLGANIRREVFSIYKECINNVVKHSGATEANIEFEVIVGVLRLKIADNGRGFDAKRILSSNFTPDKGGNGLINIRRRVSDLNGTCDINSSSTGTSIALFIPLSKEQEEVSLTLRTRGDGQNGRH